MSIPHRLTQVGESLGKANVPFKFHDTGTNGWLVYTSVTGSEIEVSEDETSAHPLEVAVRSYDRSGGMSGEFIVGVVTLPEHAAALVVHVYAEDKRSAAIVDAALAVTERG